MGSAGQLRLPDVCPDRRIVNAADVERLPLENHGLPLPFQHGDAALRNAGFHLLRTAAPELVVAGDIKGGIGPAQSLDDGPGVLLRQSRGVVQNVASQQHQIRVLFLHHVQQLLLTLAVVTGVEVGEQHQPDGLGDLVGLHRVVLQGEAGIEGGSCRRDGRCCLCLPVHIPRASGSCHGISHARF